MDNRRLYAQNFEKYYFFAEYGDYDNFFIKLFYLIKKNDFTTQVGSPLRNITAVNGLPIFRNENLDFSKYTLLKEETSDADAGFMNVTEIYGFAPDVTYRQYTSEPIEQFGIEDPSGYLQKQIPDSIHYEPIHTYNVVDDTFTLKVSGDGSFSMGDLVRIDAIGGSSTWYNGHTPSVGIISISSDGTQVTIPAVQITWEKSDATWSKQRTINFLNDNNRNGNGWYGSVYLIRAATTRTPVSKISNVEAVISFSQFFPALEEKFTVSSGDGTTDTITTTTVPNVDTWKEMIASETYINAQDAAVEIVYPNTFYKKTVKRVLAR